MSLLFSTFFLGHKSALITEMVALLRRRNELKELLHLLEQELKEEDEAIDRWLQDLPQSQRPLVDNGAGHSADSRLRIVGVRVSHPAHGVGTIMSFAKEDARCKPILVLFDDGQQHRYSWASTLKKLVAMVMPQPNEADRLNPMEEGPEGVAGEDCRRISDPADLKNVDDGCDAIELDAVQFPLDGWTDTAHRHSDAHIQRQHLARHLALGTAVRASRPRSSGPPSTLPSSSEAVKGVSGGGLV